MSIDRGALLSNRAYNSDILFPYVLFSVRLEKIMNEFSNQDIMNLRVLSTEDLEVILTTSAIRGE